MRRAALLIALLPLGLAGCHPAYSPNTYAASAAQVEANVQRGVIIGVRPVVIAANGTVGAATGAAVGGVAGSQVAGAPVVTALGAIGGTLVGGIGGTAAAQAVADAKGWEYIVQEDGDKLVSVTQTSKAALPIGQHVLVIAGTQQARIVPDYTVQIAVAPPAPKPTAPPSGPVAVEMNINPVLPDEGAGDLQTDPAGAAPGGVTPAVQAPPPPAAANDAANGTVPAEAKVTSAGGGAGAPVTGAGTGAAVTR